MDGNNVFALTDVGVELVESESRPAPWERMGSEVDSELIGIRDTAFEVGAALMQVARTGSSEQVVEAKAILADTKRQIYQLLAREDTEATADSDFDGS